MTTVSLSKSEPLWTKNFVFVFLSNLFLFLGFQMLIPTLPVYVSQHGGSSSAIGLVTGIFTFSALLIRPFSGAALDTMDKKTILAMGVILCLSVIGGYHWAVTAVMVLSLRVIHGLGWGISTTTYGTIASDLVPVSRRGEGMGYFGMSSTIAMSLGPIFGIWLMRHYGFATLFALSALSTLLALLLSQVISVPTKTETKPSNQEAGSLVSRLIEKSALFPSFLMLLLGLTYGGIAAFITLFGKEAGIENVGWFFLFNALLSFLVRPFSGKIFDQKGPFWVLTLGAASCIIGLALLSSASTTTQLILAAIFYGIGFGSILPSIQAWVINRAIPSRRGAANATFYSAFDLGIGGGAIILSIIAGLTNYAHMYRYSILSLVVYLAVYLIYAIKNGSVRMSR